MARAADLPFDTSRWAGRACCNTLRRYTRMCRSSTRTAKECMAAPRIRFSPFSYRKRKVTVPTLVCLSCAVCPPQLRLRCRVSQWPLWQCQRTVSNSFDRLQHLSFASFTGGSAVGSGLINRPHASACSGQDFVQNIRLNVMSGRHIEPNGSCCQHGQPPSCDHHRRVVHAHGIECTWERMPDRWSARIG